MTEEHNEQDSSFENLTPDTLDGEDKVQYTLIKHGFESDPASIPEKFQNTEDPALEYLKSYKSLASMTDLEREFHAQRNAGDGGGVDPQAEPEEGSGDTETPQTEEVSPLPEFQSGGEDASEIGGLSGAKDIIASNGGDAPPHVRKYLQENHNFTDSDIDSVIIPSVKAEMKEDAEQVLSIVGGKEKFQTLYKWVTDNKTEEQVASINSAARDPQLREPLIRGLMAEAGLMNSPTTEVNPKNTASASSVQPYASQTELNQDLLSTEIQDAFHPNHAKKQAEIQARMEATPPGILS